ncbi:hypothetical protein [Pseudomonas lini]
MNTVKRFALLISFFTLLQTGYSIAASAVLVGNAPGQSQIAQGPAKTLIDMASCRFSMTLSQDQWVQFSGLDLVFVAAKQLPRPTNAPRLWQATTSSGYEWHFEKPGSLS